MFWGIKEDSPKLLAYIEKRFTELSAIAMVTGLVKSPTKSMVMNFIDKALEVQSPIKNIPFMRYDNLSGSYKILAKVFYLLVFGKDAYTANQAMQGSTQTTASSTIEVRMGRDSLTKKCCFFRTIDLCAAFEDITTFPFVSYVLQKNRKDKLNISKQAVMEAADLSHRKMNLEPSSYLPDQLPANSNGCSIDLSAMWKNTSYKLTNDELKGLLLFLYFARFIDKRNTEEESFTLNMLRCQKKGEELITSLN